jgi:hypothetical protein
MGGSALARSAPARSLDHPTSAEPIRWWARCLLRRQREATRVTKRSGDTVGKRRRRIETAEFRANDSVLHAEKRRSGAHVRRAACVGLLVHPGSQVGLLARVLERAGTWTCELADSSSPPGEPPDWDALLVDASVTTAPARVAEHFGTSAAVVAVIREPADLLTLWHEIEGTDAFVYQTADAAELLLRVWQAIGAHERQHVIRAGRVHVDLLRHAVSVGDFSAELTSGEALVLGCLARTSGRWWNSVDLVGELGTAHQTSDSIWQYVHHLRTKLGPWQAVIESSRSCGYRLNPCAKPSGE